jgi:8-oxo-dGTP diphosphatase/2-hydroxy-dATP diphosphatase
MKKVFTLCMVCTDTQVLLGMKKRGFGEGRWNGFGGKVEEGESVEAAAAREMKEESNLEPLEMEEIGVVDFSFESEPRELEVHIFKVTKFSGEPLESEEMRPQWFSYEDVPFSQMWPDDPLWFPYLQNGKKFQGKFHFDRPSDSTYMAKILKQQMREIQ